MTFSAADEFLSVRGPEESGWQGGADMDPSGPAFGGDDERQFVDDMLLNTDDVDTFWFSHNEAAAFADEPEAASANPSTVGERGDGAAVVDHVEQNMLEQTVKNEQCVVKGEPAEVTCTQLATTNMETPSLANAVETPMDAALSVSMGMPSFLQDNAQLEFLEGFHMPALVGPYVSVDSELGSTVDKTTTEMQEIIPHVQASDGGKVPSSISPVSNSPGDQSPLSNFGAIQDTLMQVPATKPRKSIKGGRGAGRSVSEKFIVKATPKTRTYANPTASHFCHICWRRAKYTPMAVCANIKQSSCRKVICKKCFVCFKWDWEAAVADGSNFQCTHCLNTCPEGAQCYTYGKTNLKRRSSKTKLPSPIPS
eukprot:CAMPEP_0198722276 /NCGR_PEP_ID=MMETSP1475-20131203/58_1 /TAXON_ID= ORGANISM="Unidentified sp., Strain CCMP1999" /NCGR_SAMPLE_ID=MMETSP1475 /ASSEMBLY_ACC=CAM_ASM_001111 /LENGTH=366 /DNA_ID=CAMNT_0044483175 /DNA_START=190 /DNA_END=1290 /DNA_ORIENTATION=+